MSPVAISGVDKQGVDINGVQVKQSLIDTSETVNKGVYAATTLSAVDPDLAIANIRDAITIFGKLGTLVAGVDVSDADALVTDVKDPKTFYSVAAPRKTGTMPTVAIVEANDNYPAGYHAGDAGGLDAIDLDLASANIKSGVTIFGKAGAVTVQDIAVADLIEAEAPTGKKFFSITGGVKTGTGTKTLNPANENVPAGYYAATTLSAVDGDLAAANIQSGKTIFGFLGTLGANSVIYAAGAGLQKVRKILKSDMTTVLDSADYTGTIYALAQDTLYIYAAGDILKKVRRILKSDMATVLDSADYGGTIDALAQDTLYIYTAGAIQKVRKILKSDMTTVLDSADYTGTIYALAQDTLYIYAGGAVLHKVRKILKADMTTVLDSADYGGTIRALAQDTSYIYAAGDTLQKVRRILKSDMATVLDSADYGGAIKALTQDTLYIYAAGATLQKVRKILKSDMTTVLDSAAYGGTIDALAQDTLYIYAAGATLQKVRKILKSDMTTVLDSAAYGGTIYALQRQE